MPSLELAESSRREEINGRPVPFSCVMFARRLLNFSIHSYTLLRCNALPLHWAKNQTHLSAREIISLLFVVRFTLRVERLYLYCGATMRHTQKNCATNLKHWSRHHSCTDYKHTYVEDSETIIKKQFHGEISNSFWFLVYKLRCLICKLPCLVCKLFIVSAPILMCGYIVDLYLEWPTKIIIHILL